MPRPYRRDKSLCIDCKVEPATEFMALTGYIKKEGYCKVCYERMVRCCGLPPHKFNLEATQARVMGVF